jgi:hypothetical protein
MKYILVLALLALLTGCAPKDPFDRKVKASTPHHLSQWWEHTRDDFSEADQEEIVTVIRFLQDYTPRLRPMTALDPYDPLCKQINGLPLRDVLAFGYREHNRYLRNQLLNDTQNLPRFTKTLEETEDDALREYTTKLLENTRNRMNQTDARIAKNNRRIAELGKTTLPENAPKS